VSTDSLASNPRTAGLRPWKPGESGNPKGRPRKRPLSDRYLEQLERMIPHRINASMRKAGLDIAIGATWGDAIAAAAVREAVSKNGTLARKDIREAIEGKSTQRFEINPHAEQGVELLVVYEKALDPKYLRERAEWMRERGIPLPAPLPETIETPTPDTDDDES
jgi:hypothetical protein